VNPAGLPDWAHQALWAAACSVLRSTRSTVVDRDDLYQEGYLGLAKMVRSWVPGRGQGLERYVMICARRRMRRRLQRFLGRSLAEVEREDLLPAKPEARQEVDEEFLQRLCRGVPAEVVEILKLRATGLTYRAVAQRLGLPQTTMYQRLRLARATLLANAEALRETKGAVA